MSIGARLKEFAENNFKNTAEFARQYGKNRSFFYPYFSDKNVPGGEVLKRLAELGCDINWLLTGEKVDAKDKGERNASAGHSSQVFSGDISNTGGNQMAGNITGENLKLRTPAQDSPEVARVEAFYTRIIEQKDMSIAQLNATIDRQESELKRMTELLKEVIIGGNQNIRTKKS